MTRDDKFYEDPNGLWNTHLKKKINASDEQMKALLETLRAHPEDERIETEELKRSYLLFSQNMRNRLNNSSQAIDTIFSIFSPTQLR